MTMKIPVDKMKLILQPSVKLLRNTFTRHNYEIRVVGGAVRDLLMDKVPKDLDFATTATPTEMKEMFRTEEIRTFQMNSVKRGTITARIEEDSFACSTLRTYKILDDALEGIEFIQDWKQDASVRDFTMNAMFLDFDGTIYDYFDGIQHIKEKKVKFVGSPDDRIKEDPLRILRYFRFFSMLADDPNTHEPEVIASIMRNHNGLSKVSGQRKMSELRKILSSKYKFELLLKMVECGIGHHIGLTDDFDLENLQRIYKNLKDTHYHYCTLLTAGMTSQEKVDSFINDLKCNNEEKEVLLFIFNFRNLIHNIQSLKDIRDALLDFAFKRGKSHGLALHLSKQLLLYTGRKDLLPEVNESIIPRFPIHEGLLEDKVEKKKFISKEMRLLFNMWKESDCTLTRDELLNKV